MAKILIVEDDINIAKMIAATISIVGYTYDTCDNGRDAVKKVFDQDYDLILLDVMLPELDGFAVMDEIQSREIPVIFLTARRMWPTRCADYVLGRKIIWSSLLKRWSCWRG